MLLLGLFAFPGSAGQDPYHIHIVIGETVAERARALMLHILRERAGIDGFETPGPSAGWGAAHHVRVMSVRATNDGAGAVFSTEISGAVLAAVTPFGPVPSDAASLAPHFGLGESQTVPRTSDPPPRPA